MILCLAVVRLDYYGALVYRVIGPSQWDRRYPELSGHMVFNRSLVSFNEYNDYGFHVEFHVPTYPYCEVVGHVGDQNETHTEMDIISSAPLSTGLEDQTFNSGSAPAFMVDAQVTSGNYKLNIFADPDSTFFRSK